LERLTSWIDRYRLQAEAAYRRLDAVLAASVVRPPSLDPRPANGTTQSEGEKE
jgi:hypothetical protein